MDFCAGIGGGRIGLSHNGLKCVAYSEIDQAADNTYKLFFGNNEKNLGDLMSINIDELPDFDILIAGFPCQTFSIVGKRAGFSDSRGQIIYGIYRILKEKNVSCFILENVKGLVNHENGNTLKSIIKSLENLDYDVYCSVLDSSDFGVPQMRERVYFVGIKNDIPHKEFVFPKPIKIKSLKNFLIDEKSNVLPLDNPTFQKYLQNKYNKGKHNINELLKTDYIILDTRQSDLRIYKTKCPTLRTGRHGILYTKNGKLHKLSGMEALLLQGFPKEYAVKKLPSNRLLSQAGNAMTVNVIEMICKSLIEVL